MNKKIWQVECSTYLYPVEYQSYWVRAAQAGMAEKLAVAEMIRELKDEGCHATAVIFLGDLLN